MGKYKCILYNFEGEHFISVTAAEKALNLFVKYLKKEIYVEIDFEGIKTFSIHTMSICFGGLYKYFSKEEIEKYISVINVNEYRKQKLKRIIENSKEYWDNYYF